MKNINLYYHLLLVVLTLTSFASAEEEPVVNYGTPAINQETRSISSDFERDIKSGNLRHKTNQALNAIIRLGAYKLKRAGHVNVANQLVKDWEDHWWGYLNKEDLGDHAPLSTWLAEKYALLEFMLGADVCHALRLDDIKVINFALPVVISCVDKVDSPEYLLHFQPLCGLISFWGSFFGCVGGTWGTGFLWCSPIAMGVEYLTERFVAPRLNDFAWAAACMKNNTSEVTYSCLAN